MSAVLTCDEVIITNDVNDVSQVPHFLIFNLSFLKTEISPFTVLSSIKKTKTQTGIFVTFPPSTSRQYFLLFVFTQKEL